MQTKSQCYVMLSVSNMWSCHWTSGVVLESSQKMRMVLDFWKWLIPKFPLFIAFLGRAYDYLTIECVQWVKSQRWRYCTGQWISFSAKINANSIQIINGRGCPNLPFLRLFVHNSYFLSHPWLKNVDLACAGEPLRLLLGWLTKYLHQRFIFLRNFIFITDV